MFKVGDRVFLKETKDYGIIKKILKPKSKQYYMEDKNGFWFEEEILLSAQSMFEELGYKKSITIIEEREDGFTYVGEQYEIEFDYSFKGYAIHTDFIPHINTQLHKAIHQQLIELG